VTDGIDRDHFLDYSAKSKIFNLPKLIQLLRCDPPSRASLRRPSMTPIRRPAIRWSVTSPLAGRSRIRGSLCVFPRCTAMASGMGPELLVAIDLTPGAVDGGDEETRTPDPLLAKEMLYQLSYVPASGGWVWWAFLDSNQRPLPYQGSALTS
jgi:hypothetical protein